MTIRVGRPPENLSVTLVKNSDNDLAIPMATADGTPLSLDGIDGLLTFQSGMIKAATVTGSTFRWSFAPTETLQLKDGETVEFAVSTQQNRRVLARGNVRIK